MARLQTKSCDIREIEYKFDDGIPTTEIPIKNFSTIVKNVKPENVLYNINKQINTNDTSTLDFTYGGTNNNFLEPVSTRFCDNIIFYFIIPEEIVKNDKTLLDYVNKKDSHKESTEDTNNKDKVLKKVAPFLANNTENLKMLLNKNGVNINKRDIKPTNYKADGNTIRQYIKVALPDVELNVILDIITNRDVIDSFNKEGLFINDVDITQDYKGVINKKNIIDYLLTKPNFRFAKEYMDAEDWEQFVDINGCTILDNDNLVGGNCLTFISKSIYGTVRYKFYNKFVQSLESPSVRGKVGNHYADWIDNPEDILKESISKATDTGLLRLEITFYIENQAITADYIEEHLNYLSNLLPKDLLYYNSIASQWQIYQTAIKYNLCIVDLDNNIAFLCYSVNSITGKANGFYIKNLSTNKLSNIIKLYSFNVPIVVLSYKRNIDNLLLQHRTFEKELINGTNKFAIDNLITYLTNGSKYFTPKIYKENFNLPEHVGLVDSPIIRLRYPIKKNTYQITTRNIPIVLKQIDFQIKFPTESVNESKRKFREQLEESKFIEENSKLISSVLEENKLLQEELSQKKANIVDSKVKELMEKNQKIMDANAKRLEEYNKNMEKYNEQQEFVKLKNHIIKSFEIPFSNINKLIELKDKQHLFVFAVRFIETKYGENILIATSREATITTDSHLDIYWGVKSLYNYVVENKSIYKELDIGIIGSSLGRFILEISKEGVYYNKSRNKCANIVICSCIKNHDEIDIANNPTEPYLENTIDVDKAIQQTNWRDVLILESNNALTFRPIGGKPKIIDDLVKPGDIVEILNIYKFRKGYNLEIKIDGDIKTAKSNKFLDAIIKDKLQEDIKSKFKVVAGTVKLHPVSRRKMVSFT